MTENGRKPSGQGQNPTESRRLSPLGKAIVEGLSGINDGRPVRVVSNTYTLEERTKIGGGDTREGDRRIVRAMIRVLGDALRGNPVDPVRPFQEMLDTPESTEFGAPPISTKTN